MRDSIIGSVPDDWQFSTLGEACNRGGGSIQTGPFGSQLHAADYVSNGIPSVMPQNIGDNTIVEEGIARVSLEDADRLRRYLLAPGDIVYSRRGDVERRALVSERHSGWLCGTGCLRVRPGGQVNARFLSYYLGHPEVRAWIVRHAIGATMPNLNTSILSSLPVVLPPLPLQETVGRTLGAIDDKIALSERIAKTALQLADAKFQAALGQGVSTSPVALGELVRHGMLELGDGYRTKRSELGRPGLPILRVAEVQDARMTPGFNDHVSDVRRGAMGNKVSRPRDVVLTTKGTVGRVFIMPADSPDFVYSPQLCFFRTNEQTPFSNYYLFSWFRSDEFWRQARGMKSQTDMADYLSLGDIRSLTISIPDREVEVGLSDGLAALLSRLEAAYREIDALVKLRDALLPALISGRMEVEGIAKASTTGIADVMAALG
ncbi:restriction endonuclease subunit S [Micromonospora chokoriensis]